MLWVIFSLLAVGAIVNGPLFSLDASGAVGKAIVFTKWKGRNVVREYVTPANPRSILQRGRRTMVSLINSIWSAMDTTDRDSWVDLATAGNYSNFNGMTSYNLDQQTIEGPPTKNRGDTPTAVTATVSAMTATPGTNRVDIEVTVGTAMAESYGLVALIAGGTSPGVDLLRIVGRFDSTTTGAKEVAVTDLPAGEYSAAAFAVSNDGAISAELDTDVGFTVTGV